MKTSSKTAPKAKTKKAMVITHLKKGKSLTKAQASTLYGVKNLRATVSDIRQNEFNVETSFGKNGEVSYKKVR